MILRRLRYGVEYAGYRAAAGALGLCSLERARRIGQGLGSLAYGIDRARRRLALANLALALPERSPAEHRQIARDSFRSFGAAACESVVAARLGPDGIAPRFEVEGWEHLERARAGGGGVFLMSAHLGPGELAAYPVGERVGRLHLLARPPNNPRVADHVLALRERWGHRVIAKRGAGLKMLRAIRRGGVVGVLIDQRVRPGQGIRVPFFGRPALASPMLAYLSLQTRAPVVPAFCRAEGAGGYRLRFHPALAPDAPEPSRQAEAALTERYLAVVESEIRASPGLWLWPHRRWEL